jgi:hypothetical protein
VDWCEFTDVPGVCTVPVIRVMMEAVRTSQTLVTLCNGATTQKAAIFNCVIDLFAFSLNCWGILLVVEYRIKYLAYRILDKFAERIKVINSSFIFFVIIREF